jgi:hypothetical protein
MLAVVNECRNRMWTDGLHRVEITSATTREWDGANVVEGVMRADTAEALKANPRPIDVPFSAVIPAGLDALPFHAVCTDMFYKIQNGESLMNLDYSPPPQPVQAQTNWGGIAMVGLLGLVFVGLAAAARN